MADASTHVEASHDEAVSELAKEAATMALYVAICVLAALTALDVRADSGHVDVVGVIWGTTIGLALAHLFAFRISARLVSAGTISSHDARVSAAQVVGAVVVAALATGPVLILPASATMDAVRLVLAGVIASFGFVVARASGGGRLRSAIYATSVLLVGVCVAVLKNVLSGH
jgi:hypothetical protein